MKFNISEEWCEAIESLEDGFVIGAGALAMDPEQPAPAREAVTDSDEGRIAFGQFVTFSRREQRLSIEDLAAKTDIDLAELIAIERLDPHYQADARSVYQLAEFFHVSRPKLMVLAGLSYRNDNNVVQEALKFAAKSVSVEQLTPTEKAVLEGYVAVLTEHTDR